MKALILGATGATGKDLLSIILKDEAFDKVDIFVRKDTGMQHPKLTTHVVDFESPEKWQHLVNGDVLFSCLGTTLKKAESKDAQWKVDYEYQHMFAQKARQNGVHSYILVSATGASSSSPFFYLKMKGKLEDAVKGLNFNKMVIFNPPTLMRENSDRPMEVFSVKALKALNAIGLFKSQKPLSTKTLAQAMVVAAKKLPDGLRNIQAQEIEQISHA